MALMTYCNSCDDVVRISFTGKCKQCGKQTSMANMIDSSLYDYLSDEDKEKYRNETINQINDEKQKEYEEETSDVNKGLLITTTDTIANKTITGYLNVVSSAEYFNPSGIIGEGMANTDSYYSSAYKAALKTICTKAKSIGADAIIGLSVSTAGASGSYVLVTVTGTAVITE